MSEGPILPPVIRFQADAGDPGHQNFTLAGPLTTASTLVAIITGDASIFRLDDFHSLKMVPAPDSMNDSAGSDEPPICPPDPGDDSFPVQWVVTGRAEAGEPLHAGQGDYVEGIVIGRVPPGTPAGVFEATLSVTGLRTEHVHVPIRFQVGND